jgi:hypothetical protein
MEGTRQATPDAKPDRHFRDQSGEDRDQDRSVEIGFRAEGPIEVNMTNEPGGDPYNHTGRFRRMYR